jgi:hypothetical protein
MSAMENAIACLTPLSETKKSRSFDRIQVVITKVVLTKLLEQTLLEQNMLEQ